MTIFETLKHRYPTINIEIAITSRNDKSTIHHIPNVSRRKYCYLSQQPYYGPILKVMHIIDAVEQPENGRTSIRPSVYLPIDRQKRRRPMGLLLSAQR